jgi:hypothetical protein
MTDEPKRTVILEGDSVTKWGDDKFDHWRAMGVWPDSLHPTAEAHSEMARHLAEAINAMPDDRPWFRRLRDRIAGMMRGVGAVLFPPALPLSVPCYTCGGQRDDVSSILCELCGFGDHAAP